MCGIAGVLNLSEPVPIPRSLLDRMNAAQAHRGPDENGVYLDDWVGLGHTRLSIIDLAGGSQPIHNEDKTLWIVYNGEVFNYLELREELESKGHRFATRSDTEVVLHLYEEEGPESLNRLNGQFALAIWNTRERELFLARDRLGIRPLHYTEHNGRLFFASEVKAIFQEPSIPRAVDPVAVAQTLTFWSPLVGRTAFKGVHELPPGHYLKIRDGRVEKKRYWDIPFRPKEELIDWEPTDIQERLRELLLDAVRIRLRADVPVGCYLSGGLDSSLVTTLVARNFNHNVRTCGIRFEDPAFDEGEHQQLMVSFLGVDHEEIRATHEKIGANFPKTIFHCEKPLLRTAPVPLFLLSSLVRERDLKVVLTGEGADEVFGGYNIFRETKVRRFWARNPKADFRASLIGRLYPYVFDDPRLEKTLQVFFSRGLDAPEDPFFSHQIRWENTGRLRGFLSKEAQARVEMERCFEEVRKDLPNDFNRWDTLSKAQYLEMRTFLSNYLLSSQGDRVAMANSVEIRVPFLDYRLLDFMGTVPAHWKIHGLEEKFLLRKTFGKDLPDSIHRRPKHPYRAPTKASLLGGANSDYAEELLSDRMLAESGLFDAAKVRRLVRKLSATDKPSELDGMALVGILSTQSLHDQFVGDGADFPTTQS